jgi:hypothetical protein
MIEIRLWNIHAGQYLQEHSAIPPLQPWWTVTPETPLPPIEVCETRRPALPRATLLCPCGRVLWDMREVDWSR